MVVGLVAVVSEDLEWTVFRSLWLKCLPVNAEDWTR